MKRKILLLLTSSAILGSAFLVYRAASQFGRTGQVIASPGQGGPELPDGQGAVEGRKLNIKRSGPDGRLESIYRASRLFKERDGSYTLISPQFEIFLRNGQNLLIEAERGNVTGEEVAGGVEPHQGTLTGKVRITIDRNPGPTPPSERIEETVRIRLDDITFDNQFLTLRSTGQVIVYSREADIYGKGFYMGWNQQPRELRELRIDQGQSMHLKELGDRLDQLFLPNDQDASASRDRPTAETEGHADPNDPQTEADNGQPTDPFVTRPARNVYVADLHENVRVKAGDGNFLQGADRLTLVFEWTGELDDPAGDNPGHAPDTQPGPGAEPDSDTDDGNGQQQARTPGAGIDLVEIFWTGPLVITPQGRTENPSAKRYAIFAEGPWLHLAYKQFEAYCQEFAFRNPEKVGELRNPDKKPVRLVLDDGQTILAPLMQFDWAGGEAFFTGPGEMISPAGSSRQMVTRDPALQTEPDGSPPVPSDQTDRITWTDQAQAVISKRTVTGPDGQSSQKQIIEEVTFTGDVEMLSASGDYVVCDRKLEVYMDLGQAGRSYPEQVIASGNVSANWEESALEAATVTLDFQEVEQTDAHGVTRRQLRATHLEATGEVWVASVSRDQLLQAWADSLRTDLVHRTARLDGNPARVRSAGDTLSGRQINLSQLSGGPEDKPRHLLTVDGAGQLYFQTDRDLDGGSLDKARPITISWTDNMSFRGDRNTADFIGSVVMQSKTITSTPDDSETVEIETLTAEKLEVEFVDKPDGQDQPDARDEQEQPKDSDPPSDPAEPLALRMEGYSNQSISLVTATGEVEFISRQRNSRGQRLQRFFLTGPKMVYDATPQAKRMDVKGAGTLLVEDYRPSRLPKGKEKPDREDSGGLTGGAVSPAQTSFAWTRSVTYKQQDREVILEGKVRMAHVSGNRVVWADRLNAPAWPKQDSGRRMDLRHAETVIATFAEEKTADGQRTSQTQADTDPEIGVLKTLTARGSVLLETPLTSITAQSLKYSRPLKMVTVRGALPGRPPARAVLTRKDPRTGRTSVFRGGQILWFLENDHVQAKDVSAGGAR